MTKKQPTGLMGFLPGPIRRWPRVIAYTGMAVAGVMAMVWPSPSVRTATAPLVGLVYLWAVLLIVGGLTAAYGAVTGRWIGEYVGLWPLIATFTVYGISSLATGRVTAFAGGVVLGAVGAFLLGRWRDVDLVRREAARAGTNREEGGVDVG